MNWIPWILFVFASAVALFYWREYTKAIEMTSLDCQSNEFLKATIRSQTQTIAYFKDQNNRLRSLLNLSVDCEVQPREKVIVLSRRRKIDNTLTPRAL